MLSLMSLLGSPDHEHVELSGVLSSYRAQDEITLVTSSGLFFQTLVSSTVDIILLLYCYYSAAEVLLIINE